MNFLNKKIKFIYNQSLQTSNSVDKKVKNFSNPKSQREQNKIPSVLYDSDWISPGHFSEGSIIGNVKNCYFFYGRTTSLYNQEVPFSLFYNVDTIINIPNEYVANIKPIVMHNIVPETKSQGVLAYQLYEYTENFYQLKGDSTLIYQGFYPEKILFTENERLNGDFNASLTSKWYYGTINYTESGNTYKLSNGYIDSVRTSYDVEPLFGHPGYNSYKIFDCPAIDSISSSSVTGTGSYIVHTAYVDEEDNPHEDVTVTKNVTMTTPLFEDVTTIRASGFYHINGVLQTVYTLPNKITIIFEGSLGGGASLSSFLYLWVNPSGESAFRKLFYSDKRAIRLQFDKILRTYDETPSTVNYQTGILPYTKLYVFENPDGFPKIEQEGIEYNNNNQYVSINKIAENKYQIRLIGELYFTAPATVDVGRLVNTVNESYSQAGSTYLIDGNNRPQKEMPLYQTSDSSIKFRWIIMWNNPLNFQTDKQYKINHE